MVNVVLPSDEDIKKCYEAWGQAFVELEYAGSPQGRIRHAVGSIIKPPELEGPRTRGEPGLGQDPKAGSKGSSVSFQQMLQRAAMRA